MFFVIVGVVGLLVGYGISYGNELVPDAEGTVGVALPAIGRGIVSTANSAAWLTLTAVIGWQAELLAAAIFASVLIALAAVDVARFRLPDRILLPGLGVSIAVVVMTSLLGDATEHIVPALVGMVVYFVFLLLPNLVSPAGLAFGDVKLALLIGLFLGWTRTSAADGITIVIYALAFGMLLGVFSGLFVGIARKLIGPTFLPDPDFPIDPAENVSVMKTAFPFGPALALSGFATFLLSPSLVSGTALF